MNIRNYFIASATLILAVLAFGSCKEYEDDLQKLGGRVVVLENSNLGYTKAYIDSLTRVVQALEIGDYVTNLSKHDDGSVTIVFKKMGSVTLYPGLKGENGRSLSVQMGVKQDPTDGVYYWYWLTTGDWVTDSNGNKLRVGGDDGNEAEYSEPRVKVDALSHHWLIWNDETGKWEDTYVSADGEDGTSDYIVEVIPDYVNGTVTLVTADGQELTFFFI